jgi:hypothetical protein
MAKKKAAKTLAETECYMGPGDYTYRIEEVYDKRLGYVVYELLSTYRPTEVSSLMGEFNTRANAREAMVRLRERDSKKKEAGNG